MLLYFASPKSLKTYSIPSIVYAANLFMKASFNPKRDSRADTQIRTEISGLEDPSTNHCAIPAWRLSKFSKLRLISLIWWGRPFLRALINFRFNCDVDVYLLLLLENA